MALEGVGSFNLPRVKGSGSGYWHVVGEVEELINKTKEINQRTLCWDWLCADFEKDLGRQRRIIFAAFSAGVLGVLV